MRSAPASLAPSAGAAAAAIGVLLLSGGLYTLLPSRDTATRPRRLGASALLAIGGGTGFVSALTGAGMVAEGLWKTLVS